MPKFKQLLRISPLEATFLRRGFQTNSQAKRQLLERVGFSFLTGYNAALEDGYSAGLISRLESVDDAFRGFGYEGAAMGLKLLDCLTPWKTDRFRQLAEREGNAHIYMLHVGAGWALARLPWSVRRFLRKLDPLFRWLAVDGCGFHEGYFHCTQTIVQQRVPRRFQGDARRAFDQGLGRSLWFVEGADVERIRLTVAGFPKSRQADLWAGVGLACTYAGGLDRRELQSLSAAASSFRSDLAQGAAFAAKARLRAGNLVEHTETACRALCRMSAAEAAALTDQALFGLESEGHVSTYEVWRQRVRESLRPETVLT